MPERSWEATKRFVYERAQGCCEYCRTCDTNTGQTMHVEHILPNGDNDPENLCLACPNCNLSKAVAVIVVDALTGSSVPLFNPRRQRWSEHFVWIDNYTRIQGRTAIGRATVERLKMNRPRMVSVRQRWAKANLHPPID
ncbi:MAG: HNH endonuclease signature motif containing protein [Caldilineaceae bacterium]